MANNLSYSLRTIKKHEKEKKELKDAKFYNFLGILLNAFCSVYLVNKGFYLLVIGNFSMFTICLKMFSNCVKKTKKLEQEHKECVKNIEDFIECLQSKGYKISKDDLIKGDVILKSSKESLNQDLTQGKMVIYQASTENDILLEDVARFVKISDFDMQDNNVYYVDEDYLIKSKNQNQEEKQKVKTTKTTK